MNDSDSNFQTGELTISLSMSADGVIQMVWQGTSDARDPQRELGPFLTKVARDLAGKSATVDFTKLEYMNSATVSSIIQFARMLDSCGIKTKFLYDASIGWQRVNFVCMKAIAKTLTHVEVDG